MNVRELFLKKLADVRRAWKTRPMTKEMEVQVRAIVKSEAKRIVDENVRLKLVLTRIINDLPQRRDWLDPDVEQEARALMRAVQPPEPEPQEAA
jgi:hypothetical protein